MIFSTKMNFSRIGKHHQINKPPTVPVKVAPGAYSAYHASPNYHGTVIDYREQIKRTKMGRHHAAAHHVPGGAPHLNSACVSPS